VIETFAALSEPNRYRIVELLRSGPRAVNDIGEPRAQQRLYELRAKPLRQMHDWLERYRRIWEERFEELDELVEELKEKEKSHGNRNRK
jgi:hypothetical protein